MYNVGTTHPSGLAANGLVKVGGAAARAHLCHLGNRLAGVVGWQCHAPVTQDLQACMHCEPSKLGLRTGQQPLPTWQKGRVGSASTQAAGRGVVVSKTFRVYTSLDRRHATLSLTTHCHATLAPLQLVTLKHCATVSSIKKHTWPTSWSTRSTGCHRPSRQRCLLPSTSHRPGRHRPWRVPITAGDDCVCCCAESKGPIPLRFYPRSSTDTSSYPRARRYVSTHLEGDHIRMGQTCSGMLKTSEKLMLRLAAVL